MAYKEENYLYLSSYKLYQGFLTLSRYENNNEQENQIEQDIQQTHYRGRGESGIEGSRCGRVGGRK